MLVVVFTNEKNGEKHPYFYNSNMVAVSGLELYRLPKQAWELFFRVKQFFLIHTLFEMDVINKTIYLPQLNVVNN